ncbi:hypothetical protein [Maricaulis salignorans]|uniref:Uncharacterized protein n=1 Tax=Maricaulis salignorans TaxID=144026 RepID=A0A1G9R149_9PROT|nr:hypothetical protein [Maricaulis salignorans]SDM16964.1 hypothetical protein SAMN04488568_10623 [Maricaulis salignorans]
MKRLLALMLAVAAATPVALAQPQTEPRLAGGPERICSAAEIRQALDGSYTGSPCRFTEMPDGLEAVPAGAVALRAGNRPAMTAPTVSLQSASHSQPVLARPAQVSPEQVWPVSYSANMPNTQPPAVSQRYQGATVTTSQQPVPASGRSVHQRAPQAETVRLGDDFFVGTLVGGVERPFAPVYSYRGVILIAADGRVRAGHAGLGHRARQVRALDHRTAPVPHVAPRRAYP